MKPYINFYNHVDEKDRYTGLSAHREKTQKQVQDSHGVSTKYLNYEFDEGNYTLEALLDKQEKSWFENPKLEMWYKEKKLKAIKNNFYFNHHSDINRDILPELFFKTLNRFTKINLGYCLETNDSDLKNVIY